MDGRGGRGALRGCGMRQFRGQSMQAEGVREGHGEDRWWRSARHGVRITDNRGGAWRGGAKEACIRFADIPQIARMAK